VGGSVGVVSEENSQTKGEKQRLHKSGTSAVQLGRNVAHFFARITLVLLSTELLFFPRQSEPATDPPIHPHLCKWILHTTVAKVTKDQSESTKCYNVS